jgi:hypothetical protein
VEDVYTEENAAPTSAVDQTGIMTPKSDYSVSDSTDSRFSTDVFSSELLKNLPADVVEDKDQQEDVRKLLLDAREDLKKALRLDGGVSKEKYFVFKTEDRKRYLTIPSNSEELIKIPGWDALFSLLMELGIAMKLSDSKFNNPGASEETKKFFAGLANRISKNDWDVDEDKFMVSSTKAAERGRVTADVYALKKCTSVMNLEKYLPSSSRIGSTSYIRHYLTLISGSNNVESLKAIPDLVNKIMSNWVDIYSVQFRQIAQGTTISIGQAVGDLTRKKKIKVKKDGRTIEILKPIHAVRVSDSPFAITRYEIEHLKALEKPWDDLQAFNDRYKDGVPITEVETARNTYSSAYNEQMKFAQQTGAFKSRRMEAFKELLSLTTSSKEMKDFKLTKKTREIALDNFSKAIAQYDVEKDTLPIDIDKVLLNIRPNLPGYDREVWNVINKENVLYMYSDKQPSRRRKQFLFRHLENIHDELILYFPSVENLVSDFHEVEHHSQGSDEDYAGDSIIR